MTPDDLTARGLRVKGLDFEQVARNAWKAGYYSIHQRWPHNSGPFSVSVSRGAKLGTAVLGSFRSFEAAKAAAKADHAARIAAQLEGMG